MRDKAGIKKVSFKENQIGEYAKELSTVGINYSEAGSYENTVIIEDGNGNKTEKAFTVKVVDDYEKYVIGIVDLTVEQNSSPDWMANIEKNDKIKEITADASAVDMATPGEYTLTYTILGDDGETKIEKSVKVTVTALTVAENNTGYTEGGYEGYNSYAGDSSGYDTGLYAGGSGSYDTGSYTGSTGGGGYYPGQSWEGTKTDEGVIEDFNGNFMKLVHGIHLVDFL